MNTNNLLRIILVAAIGVVSGCATTSNPGCGVFSVKGEMTVQKGNTSLASFCNVKLTYTNISGSKVRPEIQAIFYDEKGNTIAEETTHFANIDPGRSQTLERLILCNGQTIKRMHIDGAVDTNSCSKSGCSIVCGVYRNNYFLNSQAKPVETSESRGVNQTTGALHGATLNPSSAQKEKWVTTIAEKNGCERPVTVGLKGRDGLMENYKAKCTNKSVEITCEFDGPVIEGANGMPSVLVTGKPYDKKPACWR